MPRIANRRDRLSWPEVIERLNQTRTGQVAIRLGSPGSAQATRCRILNQYAGLQAHTRREVLYLHLRQP